MSVKMRLWLIRWLMRPLFNQGPHHQAHAVQVFLDIRKAWADEFTEDNQVSRDTHLTELWHKSRGYL